MAASGTTSRKFSSWEQVYLQTLPLAPVLHSSFAYDKVLHMSNVDHLTFSPWAPVLLSELLACKILKMIITDQD
jgi:hypothetical protein